MGGFRGFTIAKVLPLSVGHDFRVPPLGALVPRNPDVTAGAAAPWARLVLRVRGARYVPEVRNSVVRPVAVEVINLMLRPHAVEMQPG